ncbi:MAG: radical SAM protein [Acidobacteria bacterium]|nr:radical SAM protein [Acidobacteriota bacterium]
MKVLLLRPHYDAHHRPAGFPIGLGYLAAVLAQAGHTPVPLDLVLYRDWPTELRRVLATHEFGLAGISCMGVQYRGACQAGRVLRERAPDMPVVFGGAHPSITPDETLQLDFVDYVVRGEGEFPLTGLADTLEQGGDPVLIPALSYRRGETIVHNPPARQSPAMDDLPFPAYHLFPMAEYFRMEIPGFPTRHPNPMQIFTSRGCPYLCIYCHDLFGKRFRPRSPENVLHEMRLLYDTYGVREFLIYDDNFTMDLPRARAICRGIIESGMTVGLQFPNGIRADRVNEDLLRLMVQAGTHSITIGVESGSPRVQRLIRKALQLEKVEEFLRLARRYGVTTNGSFIIGFPGETVAEVWQTIRYARRSDLDYAFFAFATPYPGTELAEITRRQRLRTQLLDTAMDVTTPHIETREISIPRQKWLYFMAYLAFYSRPRRLVQLLAGLFRPGMMAKYFRGILKYLSPALGHKNKASPSS